MPKKESGAIPVLVLLTAVGLLFFIFITNTFDFKDKLFSRLFPKPPSHAQEVSPSVPDEILLKFKPGVPDEAKENIRNSHGIKKEEVIDKIDVERGKVPPEVKDKIIEALKKNPRVEYAEPNYIGQTLVIPNDPGYDPNAQWNLFKLNAAGAWDISTGTSSAVVAVSDSGVLATHEDLVGKIVPGYNFVDNNTNTSDSNNHGTFVSGVVGAATDNGKGVASLGWNIPVMPVRVVDLGGGISYSNGAKSILYAADNGAKVVNMSWGGSSSSSTLQDAINYAWNKGLVLAAAGGNSGATIVGLLYPASATNILAVGATGSSDTQANFSNQADASKGQIQFVTAPGVGIYSTDTDGTFAQVSGTSFASPHVAALAALLFSANPGITNSQVVQIIEQTAKDLGTTGWDSVFGYGRIDPVAALTCAKNGVLPCPGFSPIPTPTSSSTPTPSPSPTPLPTSTPAPSDTTAPIVSITNPINNSTVKVNSIVNITASASDNVSVSKVEFYVNNSLKCTSAVTPYTCSWKVPGKKNTSYSIQVKAYDTFNNTAASSVLVTGK